MLELMNIVKRKSIDLKQSENIQIDFINNNAAKMFKIYATLLKQIAQTKPNSKYRDKLPE